MAAAVLAELAKVCGDGHARGAGPADAVAGVPVAVVVSPSTVDEVAGVLRTAAAHRLTVVPRGAATMLGAGNPPSRPVDVVVDLTRMDAVLEHAAGDLVVRAQAGVRLAALQSHVAPARQRLALDPPERAATLGGLIAANRSGPLRHRFGTIRDLLLGVTVVLADGTVARSGGKVVKNVAGYDLGKLYTGSHGTLGVVVDAVLRLHPLPPARRVVTLPARQPARVAELAAELGAAQLVPSAVEHDGDERVVTVLFEGRERAVDAQADAAARLDRDATVADRPPPWWGEHPWTDPCAGVGLTVGFAPSALLDVLAVLPPNARVRGRVATGVLEVALPAVDADWLAWARERIAPGGGSVVVVAGRVPGLDVWGYRGDALDLMRRVKDRFDPAHLLSPGRFVGGI
ncbi:MAG TPA: FAD-binding oxidoreductase [Frankiaceae bacterium]|nr:FAD-binding oxidoreductase [Frankiaceae bacterium]